MSDGSPAWFVLHRDDETMLVLDGTAILVMEGEEPSWRWRGDD